MLATTNRPNTLASWSMTHTRINLLIGEIQSTVSKQQTERSSSQLWLLKMHQFEQGLFAELIHLRGLIGAACQAHGIEGSPVKKELQSMKIDLQNEEERLADAFLQLREPSGQIANLSLIYASTKRISPLARKAFSIMQQSWKVLSTPETSENEELSFDPSNSYEDRIATLTRPGRSEGSPSMESSDPEDLTSLLTVYSAQLHSHCSLIKETADEFLSSLQVNANHSTSKQTRGYSLPTSGVLVAHAKFLLRCSSQLVNLAANLCVSLSNCTSSSVQIDLNTNQLRDEVEFVGNSVCESLKGLITQTKEVAGYLSNPGLEVTPTTAMPSKPIVSAPELERLVGSILGVVSTTNSVKALVAKTLNLINKASSNSSEKF